MEIYADPISVNSRKVLAGLKFMDVPYDLEKIDYFKGEQKGAAYLVLNPNACIPTMKDGDFVLWESNAILQYAADKHERTEAYPRDVSKRADLNRWLFWEAAHWFPSCYAYLVENCVKPLLGGQTDQSVLDAEAERFHRLAAILDERLEERSWIMGNAPTIADIAVAAPMHLHGWQKLPLDRHANLVAWMTERVENLPAWRATRVLEGFVLAEASGS